MVLRIALYVALAVFCGGVAYKVYTWFRYSITFGAEVPSPGTRMAAAIKGIGGTLFSVKFFTLFKVWVLDVMLNARILREDVLRWIMHMCIYGGFILLLVTHALGRYLMPSLVDEYYSTVNPFLFMRDTAAALVIVGVAIALYRRFILKIPRLKTNPMDVYAIIIVAVIILSGVFFQGAQMLSHRIYTDMVENYSIVTEPDEQRALEAYWVREFGVVSPTAKGPFPEALLTEGRELHEMNCAACHAPAQWAAMSYGVAKVMSPVGTGLDRVRIDLALWYLHFFACLVGLAYLPFSKMFHILASPLSLLANAVMEPGRSAMANVATRQILELDACTHCGTCTLRCSVGAATGEIPNINILPSEKLIAIKALAMGQNLTAEQIRLLQEGVYLCTNCYRCTVVCPVGINLQELWFNVREKLLQQDIPEFSVLTPLSFYRALMKHATLPGAYETPLVRAREAIVAECELMKTPNEVIPLSLTDTEFRKRLHLSGEASTFSVCFGCQTCTNVCPVVANYETPREALGLLPHQIMHACALGVRDLAFGSNMLWDCLTCYQCQEQCPQGVHITDVLYELKNLAVEHVTSRMSQTKGSAL